MKVAIFTVTHWHRLEDWTTVHASEKAARNSIANYVSDNWKNVMKDAPPPNNEEDAAVAYFENSNDESIFIERHEIEFSFLSFLKNAASTAFARLNWPIT